MNDELIATVRQYRKRSDEILVAKIIECYERLKEKETNAERSKEQI